MAFQKGNTYSKGHTPWNKGIPRTEEDKEKSRIKQLGRHHSPSTEFTHEKLVGENNPRWKGGYKLRHARSATKRRSLDFNLINELISDDMVAHHLTKEFVAYVPEFINKSIDHNIFTGKNMDEINFYTLNYLFLVYNKE